MAYTKRFALNPVLIEEDWKLTDLDRGILHVLARVECASGLFLQAYFPEHTVNGVNRAINKLRHKGLLYRPNWQRKGWATLNTSIYCRITEVGFEYIGIPVPESFKKRDPKYPTMQMNHTVAADNTLLSAEIYIKSQGRIPLTMEEIVGTSKLKDPLLFKFSITHKFPNRDPETLESYLVPDRCFADKAPGGKSRLYFIELENEDAVRRNTLGEAAQISKKTGKYTHGGKSSSLRKMLAYADIHKNSLMWKQLRKHGFTVIFAYTQKSKYKAALELKQELFGECGDFIQIILVPTQHMDGTQPRPYPELFKDILKDPTADSDGVKPTARQ